MGQILRLQKGLGCSWPWGGLTHSGTPDSQSSSLLPLSGQGAWCPWPRGRRERTVTPPALVWTIWRSLWFSQLGLRNE